jgi:hypothetical protein
VTCNPIFHIEHGLLKRLAEIQAEERTIRSELIMIDRFRRYDLPTTVDEAVDVLISDMTTQQMSALSKMDDQEFNHLCNQLVPHLQHDFGLWAGNDQLLMSCFETVDGNTSTDPMRIIMDRLRIRTQSLNDTIITV